jgi:hypothetical protein
MNCTRRRLIAFTGATLLSACGNSSGNARVRGEYLVSLTAGADAKVIRDVYAKFGIKALKDLGNGVFLLTLNDDPGIETIEKLAQRHPPIKAVQPNYTYK